MKNPEKVKAGSEVILTAVLTSSIEMLKALKDFIWPPNILAAAVKADMETFEYVLDRVRHFKSTGNSPTKFEFNSALMLCVKKNDIAKAEKLLVTGYCDVDYNPNPNKYLYGRPIVVASYANLPDMVKLLAKHDANPNGIDGDYQSPLVASMKDVKNIEAFDYLVNLKDIDIDQKQGDNGPPICKAVEIWSMHCTEALVGKGCKLDSPDEWNKLPIAIAVSNIDKSKKRISLVDYLYEETAKQGIPISVGKLSAKVFDKHHDDGAGLG